MLRFYLRMAKELPCTLNEYSDPLLHHDVMLWDYTRNMFENEESETNIAA